DIELVCVNDGSTDNSLEVLNELKDSYDILKVVSQENQGPAVARNNGLKNASGEFVGFLDADDVFLDEECLEKMYNLAIDRGLDVVSANLTFVSPDFTIEDNPHYNAGDYAYFDNYGVIHPKDYGIPYCFYKIIYNREFLISNNIVFPNIKAGEDPIFLANVFASISEIGTVPLTLYGYNHSLGGGVNAKIRTYEKKKQYIQHFKDVCEILTDAGLDDTSDFYKIHLFRFLTWEGNNQDSEIIEIFNDVWGIDNKSFDESDFNYVRFIVPAKFNLLLKFGSEELFKRITKDFLQIDIYDTKAIDEIVLEEYFMVIYAYSFEDFKSNCVKYLNNDLRFKKEFMEFKVKKFIFNINTHGTIVVLKNAKMVFNNSWIGSDDFFSKYQLRKCYEILTS
ncbi:glycosyltransferase family 2 protein, partial [Methanobrevibacter sp.]|uniref:glycosyltransferase family 2 protein n=1 Tax=Methanobrevibacter sp. TaxID=66852 RepID=UPI002E783B5D